MSAWVAHLASPRWSTTSVTPLIKNPVVGQGSNNPELREWHTNDLDRLPGLKFMRTLWVCNVAGGPFQFTATRPGRTCSDSRRPTATFTSPPSEFDEVAAELARSLDAAKVPEREKGEVLAAFAAHKGEVTEGFGHRSARQRRDATGYGKVRRTLPFARFSSTNRRASTTCASGYVRSTTGVRRPSRTSLASVAASA